MTFDIKPLKIPAMILVIFGVVVFKISQSNDIYDAMIEMCGILGTILGLRAGWNWKLGGNKNSDEVIEK
ncbi:MAG: hypothetical protein H8E40_01345 [Chloroflexi bacterium]|nr:hypothetical protein [Chloroflexota bacterium]